MCKTKRTITLKEMWTSENTIKWKKKVEGRIITQFSVNYISTSTVHFNFNFFLFLYSHWKVMNPENLI